MRKILRVSMLVVLAWVGLNAQSLSAQDANTKQTRIEYPDVTIQVKGLACPFCAYGLEKKLKKLDGVKEVYIGLDEGIAQLKVDKGKTVSEEAVKEAIQDAGFTPEKITYSSQKSTSHIPQSHEREA